MPEKMAYVFVNMVTHADIKLVRSLADKRSRTETGLFVAEGAKLVEEICSSTLTINRIYCTGNPVAHPAAEQVSTKEMERMSLLKTPTDVLAVVEIPKYRLDPSIFSRRLVLALDDVQNPGNIGTIIRLADWFGIEDIICSEATADCFNPKVVQATMGAILRVRVHYTDLTATLKSAATAHTPVYGTFLEGENIYSANLTRTGIILMGNEGRGVSDRNAQYVSRRLFIPPYPATRHGSESLNVAIATAITCAEFRRRG